MDLRHEDSLQAICCQVVRYPHVKTLSLSVPKDALVGEVTTFVKQEFPSDYKDVSAARTKVLALLKGGRYMPLGGLMESRLPARIRDFGLGFVQDLLREDSRELSLNGKIADQLPPPTNEKGVIYLAALIPCKLLACLIIGGFEEDDDFFYHGIHEGWTMRDFKIYLMKTQPVPADFKLVLATDGDQSLLCEEVVVEERNERVTTVMNALAAQEEIDLSRTVRSVFGDDSSLSCVDVLIVEQDGILGKRKDRPVRVVYCCKVCGHFHHFEGFCM
ncbi:hypothetical protein GQ600_653 [Phytophthora cactorum]|nr:hypothetical protein GQ600_653 [Phytophthora cactorum]